LKGLKKENLRDNMTNLELVLNMLAETATTEISQKREPKDFAQNKEYFDSTSLGRCVREYSPTRSSLVEIKKLLAKAEILPAMRESKLREKQERKSSVRSVLKKLKSKRN